MIEKLTNRVNKKGTRSHGHICLQPFLTPRETLNYWRVAAKNWAIPLSSTQAAFSFSAFREKGHSSVPQTDPPAQDTHRVLYCPARCANTNVREVGKNWGAMTILVFLCCIFQFFVLSFFCGRRGRLVVGGWWLVVGGWEGGGEGRGEGGGGEGRRRPALIDNHNHNHNHNYNDTQPTKQHQPTNQPAA